MGHYIKRLIEERKTMSTSSGTIVEDNYGQLLRRETVSVVEKRNCASEVSAKIFRFPLRKRKIETTRYKNKGP